MIDVTRQILSFAIVLPGKSADCFVRGENIFSHRRSDIVNIIDSLILLIIIISRVVLKTRPPIITSSNHVNRTDCATSSRDAGASLLRPIGGATNRQTMTKSNERTEYCHRKWLPERKQNGQPEAESVQELRTRSSDLVKRRNSEKAYDLCVSIGLKA